MFKKSPIQHCHAVDRRRPLLHAVDGVRLRDRAQKSSIARFPYGVLTDAIDGVSENAT